MFPIQESIDRPGERSTSQEHYLFYSLMTFISIKEDPVLVCHRKRNLILNALYLKTKIQLKITQIKFLLNFNYNPYLNAMYSLKIKKC